MEAFEKTRPMFERFGCMFHMCGGDVGTCRGCARNFAILLLTYHHSLYLCCKSIFGRRKCPKVISMDIIILRIYQEVQ